MKYLIGFAVLLGASACDMTPTAGQKDKAAPTKVSAAKPAGDGMQATAALTPDDKPRPALQLQVALDRAGFSPGIIDGKEGLSTTNAIAAFQEARGQETTGKVDDAFRAALGDLATVPATRVVTIPPDYVTATYFAVPEKAEEQAAMPLLGYANIWERLAERFHTTAAVLAELNPQLSSTIMAAIKPVAPAVTPPAATPPVAAPLAANTQLRVPNIGSDAIPRPLDNAAWQATLVSLGVGSDQPKADRIVVDKSAGTLKAYAGETIVAAFTATMGSSHDPLPLGEWKIKGSAYNPPFHYNPRLFWDVADSKDSQLLPPGPNSPVGVVWIDLTKDHYGIHGTPNPETIGRAESHGCVRLTNWDAARLAMMVKPGTRVTFEA